MKLNKSFFNQPTLKVAEDLLGKKLVFNDFVGEINETEAYIGKDDPACHAAVGKTPRNAVMFGPPGFSYVYFIYGMYFCLNIVTEKEGFPAAVLIRGVKPLSNIEKMIENRKMKDIKNLTNGPGKLCQAFGINKDQNGINICKCNDFYIQDSKFKPEQIVKTPRIGIKEGTNLLYRFVVK